MARALLLAAVLVLWLGLTPLGRSTWDSAAADSSLSDLKVVNSSAAGLTLDVEPAMSRMARLGTGATGLDLFALDGYLAGPDGLPVREVLIGLPPSGRVDVQVYQLAPAYAVQGPAPALRVPRVVEEQAGLALHATWQSEPESDQARSLPLAEIVEEGFFRQWHVARLRIAPAAYLGNGRWQVTPHFQVSIAFEQPATPMSPPNPDPFATLVQNTLLNGRQAALWPAATPPTQAATPYALPALTWRISIAADGLYRITYEALNAAGVPLAGAQAADVHLLWRDQEVALQALDNGNGSFGPGDAFLFYAQKFHGSVQDEKYTDENVYYLTLDSTTPGRRMATRSAAPNPAATPVTWYESTAHSEQNNTYWGRWSNNPGSEATWFWERTVATSATTRPYPIVLDNPSSTPHTATLHLEFAARNFSAAEPDHHVRVSLNNTYIGEDFWDGKVGHTTTLPVPSELLLDGQNTIDVTFLTDAGIQDIYFDLAQLTFHCLPIALNDQLPLSAPLDGLAGYTLAGFSSNQIRLYDLADPIAPVILTGATISPGGPAWDLSFADNGLAGQPYLALTDAQIRNVPNLTPYQPRLDLLSSSTGADEIMITANEFYPAALTLAVHRESKGVQVEVVRVEDIYPLFNGGVVHPQAIRDFLAYTYQNWSPRPAFVLLFGDGHFNFKGYNPTSYGEFTPVHIPPFLDFIDPWQGEVPVDTHFAQIVGDDTFPDLAIGRIPANSAQEAANAVAKIVAYEANPTPPWNDHLIFVADNVPDAGGDFEGVLDRLRADFVPPSSQQSQVYLTDFCGPPTNPPTPCPSATDSLLQSWSQGAALLTFLGHGAIQRWTHEPLLVNTQIGTLRPGHGLPMVITLNCLDGYWMMPPAYPGLDDARSMAEWEVMGANYGSVASFSPAGLGTTPAEELIARNMYKAMFNDGTRRLGEIALAGQLTPIAFPAHLPQVSTLFGDPAGTLSLKVAPRQLALTPETHRRGGSQGTDVIHRFTLTNQGGRVERATLTITGNTWPATLGAAQTGDLPPGAQVPVEVRVTVPQGATLGATDSATLRATSVFDPDVDAAATVVTVASRQIYLPAILRQRAGP